jgi:hypothetical protein
MASGSLEDTSASGACVRMRTPVHVGARVTIKWHREQFSAIAKNCRSEGKEYLVGMRREGEPGVTVPANDAQPTIAAVPTPVAVGKAPGAAAQSVQSEMPPITGPTSPPATGARVRETIRPQTQVAVEPAMGRADEGVRAPFVRERYSIRARIPAEGKAAVQDKSEVQEKNSMEPKGLFPKLFGRRDTREEPTAKAEVPVNPAPARLAEPLVGTKGDLLSYEDIYRAAGILGPRANYDINKVVEMMHCDRMRGMPDDVKRTSVLMAIEAAGASPDDLLRDATARQSALEKYEDGQRKQLDEFEARKTQEIAEIEGEMARVTARYAERIKANQDQVAHEREALRNWQMAKQSEGQRIAEVIDLCSTPVEAKPAAMAAAAGGAAGVRTAGPSLLPGGNTSKP